MPDLFDFSAMPRLESERLVLREISQPRDLQALFALFSDPAVLQHDALEPFQDLAEAQTLIDGFNEAFAAKRAIRWAVTLKTDEYALIGTCGYNEWHRWNNSAVIGYELMPSYWGQGFTTEALRAMIGFGFTHMALNRIEAETMTGNEGSIRVLVKLDFTEEGLLRQKGHWKGGYHDLYLFSLLRRDWSG